jgi:AraC family transcriptional regulator
MTASSSVSSEPEALATAHPEWAGLPLSMWRILAQGEMVDHYRSVPVLLLARSGAGRRWYRSGASQRELYTTPGMIELYGAGFYLDHARWEGTAGECVGVEFPAPAVSRLLRDDAPRFAPETCYELFDDRLAALALAMWQESASGACNGRLFAEGLSLALLGLLCARGASAPTKLKGVKRFSRDERRRVLEFIASSLDGDLSVEQLADSVGMSACHFARVFKVSFDRTPHRFVLERRIEAASALLRSERDRPIAEIALALGFANQAHFTAVFRRSVGLTPARWRREA